MKAYAEPKLQPTICCQYQLNVIFTLFCNIHIVLVQFCVEPRKDFNVLFFKSFLALFV